MSHCFARGVMGLVGFAKGCISASAGTILGGGVEYNGGDTCGGRGEGLGSGLEYRDGGI